MRVFSSCTVVNCGLCWGCECQCMGRTQLHCVCMPVRAPWRLGSTFHLPGPFPFMNFEVTTWHHWHDDHASVDFSCCAVGAGCACSPP
jgi:hypothetical protein